jgi:hypothetical protein
MGFCEVFSGTDSDFGDNPYGNDWASSIRVGSNVQAKVCQNTGLTGQCETFTSEDPDLNNNIVGNDTVSSISVSPRNNPPVANAGPDQTVTDTDGDGFASVTLNGSASSDPDDDPLTFVWTDGSTELQPRQATITVNLSVGTHNIQLYVGDPDLASDTDEVNITVNPKPADPPNVTLKLEVGIYDLTEPYPGYTAYGPFSPTHLDRQLTLQIVGSGAVVVSTLNPTVHFDATKKAFTASVPVHLEPGTYYVRVKLSNTLSRLQIGTFTVNATTTSVTVPRIVTMIGDVDGNNQVNLTDYNILIGCYSVLSPPKSCSAAYLPTSGGEPTTDLDDDGDVDQADYNLLLRKFQILLGD